MAAIVRATARRRLLLPRPAASRPRAATPTRHLSSAAAGPAADDELDPYHGWTFFGPPPPAVYCIGLNYKRHAAETGQRYGQGQAGDLEQQTLELALGPVRLSRCSGLCCDFRNGCRPDLRYGRCG